MPDYDNSEPSSYLMYFDVNNLYDWAMTQHLPRSNFEWVSKSLQEISNTPDDAKQGYLVEVDLEYPKELHNQHNDYPMCPEHMVPPTSESNNQKLILNLYDKVHYVLHYRTLKFVLNNGMRLKKIGQIG